VRRRTAIRSRRPTVQRARLDEAGARRDRALAQAPKPSGTSQVGMPWAPTGMKASPSAITGVAWVAAIPALALG